MLGNFSYHNATKLYFGDDSLRFLNDELPKYGKTVQLIYGGGSVKKNGIYDAVINILKANGKTVVEDAGVMPNPTADKLREGVKLARDNKVDLLLAVGGGSCCDYAKAYPSLLTAMKTPGTSISSASRNLTVRSFPSAAFSPWREQAPR